MSKSKKKPTTEPTVHPVEPVADTFYPTMPLELIDPAPDNPRRNLGDLTELAGLPTVPALVREMDSDEPDAKVLRVYPARCRFRGFSEEVETDGFKRLTAHLQANVSELVKHTEE